MTDRAAGDFGASQPPSTSPRNARQRRGMQYHRRRASAVSEPIRATSPTTIAAMPKPSGALAVQLRQLFAPAQDAEQAERTAGQAEQAAGEAKSAGLPCQA